MTRVDPRYVSVLRDPPSVISPAVARATATSEYALTSCASRNPARLVSTKGRDRSSRLANARLCTTACRGRLRPRSDSVSAVISSSLVTSHGNIAATFQSLDKSSIDPFCRSPRYVSTSAAPSLENACAMAYARLHLLAIPRMRASLPSSNLDMSTFSLDYAGYECPLLL